VDVFDIPANPEGVVHAETVLHYVIVAFEIGLVNEEWNASCKRIREMKF